MVIIEARLFGSSPDFLETVLACRLLEAMGNVELIFQHGLARQGK